MAFAIGTATLRRSEPAEPTFPEVTPTVPVLAGTDDPSPPVTRPPPTLSQIFPAAQEGMRLVIATETEGFLATWEPDEQSPTLRPLDVYPETAAFDPSGTWVAVLDVFGRLDLRFGSSIVKSVGTSVRSFAWHASVVNGIAWIDGRLLAEDGVSSAVLWTASASEGEPVLRRSLPGGSLVAWGTWGFAVQSDSPVEGPETFTLLDDTGANPAELDGEVLDATQSGTLLIKADPGAGAPSDPFLLTPDGSVAAVPPALLGSETFAITDSGEWIAGATVGSQQTSIVVISTLTNSRRVTSFAEPVRLLDFSRTDTFAIFQSETSGDLIFLDWLTGAQFRLTIPDGARVLAVDF